MSTPYWGPDFDALAAFDPDIATSSPTSWTGCAAASS